MSKNNKMAIIIIGLAWPMLGLGFLSIHFGYLPRGLTLAAEALGLFAAGCVSGYLYLIVRRAFKRTFSLSLINIGYALFAPIGIMASLLAPAPFEPVDGSVSLGFLVMAPVIILLLSTLAVAIGLGLTGGLAKTAKSLANRIQPGMTTATSPVRVHR